MSTIKKVSVLSIAVILIMSASAAALPPVDGKVFGIYPVVNEVSFFKNVEDDFDGRGWTLQVVSINEFNLITRFKFEFTGDFNWKMSDRDRDHYIELSIVKPLTKLISFNYQRILSSFEDNDVNQVGLRLSL